MPDKEYFNKLIKNGPRTMGTPVPSEGSSDQSSEQQATPAAPTKPTQEPTDGTTATNNAAEPKPAPAAVQTTTEDAEQMRRIVGDLADTTTRLQAGVDALDQRVRGLGGQVRDFTNVENFLRKDLQAAGAVNDTFEEALTGARAVHDEVEATQAAFDELPKKEDIKKLLDQYASAKVEAEAKHIKELKELDEKHVKNTALAVLKWAWVPILILFLVVFACFFAPGLGRAMGGYCAHHDWPVVLMYFMIVIGIINTTFCVIVMVEAAKDD